MYEGAKIDMQAYADSWCNINTNTGMLLIALLVGVGVIFMISCIYAYRKEISYVIKRTIELQKARRAK